MIYRLMVVDDEDFITDSLAYMLEGLEEPTLEVSKAYSAPEALALLNSHVYDIVVTDIQMPGMSGIDLLREIHAKWPSCRVIFLTGYNEFDYAYQALKYGAFRFILKNEGDDVLAEAVQECIQSICREAALTTIPAVFPVRRQTVDFLRSLVVGGAPETGCLQGELERLGLSLCARNPVLLMVGHMNKPLTDGLLAKIGWIVRDKVGHAVHCEEVKVDRQLVLWMMQSVVEGNEEHARAAITGFAEQIQEACQRVLGIHLTFVFDPEPVGWEEIPRRFTHIRYITTTYLQENSEIAMATITYFSRGSLLFPGEVENVSGEDGVPWDGCFFVERLLQYIQHNLNADLSLTALSEHMYLNPAYLSRKFKELTGHNITEVILQSRMDKARHLLRESARKISQISAMVGYDSAAHFSRTFKRYVGLTPQEYRDGSQKAASHQNVKDEQGK
ncbi:MAG TPA: response regulator [Clostridiales bacterium]|nr:response regulator [Clostridiales bacterium]